MGITANLYVTGDIFQNAYFEDEVSLNKIMQQVEEYKGEDVERYRVLINSNGGFVDEGFAIHDFLKALSKPVDTVTFNARSIASVVMQANANGGKRYIMPNATVFVHNPWTGQIGDADAMREAADLLDKAKDRILDLFEPLVSITRNALSVLLSEESQLLNDKALEYGFADEVFEGEIANFKKFNSIYKTRSELKAVAYVSEPSQESRKMGIKNTVARIFNPKNDVEINLVDGRTLTVDTQDEPKVGDVVKLDGNEAPAETYAAANGNNYQIEGGKITAIEPIENPAQASEEDDKIAEKLDTILAKLESLENGVQENKDAIAQNAKDTADELELVATKVREGIKSESAPPSRSQEFDGQDDKFPSAEEVRARADEAERKKKELDAKLHA